ncbi:uncharacterized protein LOC134380900 [Cynocephalus volans]|uniref:uncharacterized protein LOC134380900 n=1 Tax=Cynocephalus volans TaxID=110931 RepID=UPI002FCC9C04
MRQIGLSKNDMLQWRQNNLQNHFGLAPIAHESGNIDDSLAIMTGRPTWNHVSAQKHLPILITVDRLLSFSSEPASDKWRPNRDLKTLKAARTTGKTLIALAGYRSGVSAMPKSRVARLRRKMMRLRITPRCRNEFDRKILTLHSLAHLCSIFWIIFFPFVPVSGDNYWAYVPNPPLLHPVTWEDDRVPIYTNNTLFKILKCSSRLCNS